MRIAVYGAFLKALKGHPTSPILRPQSPLGLVIVGAHVFTVVCARPSTSTFAPRLLPLPLLPLCAALLCEDDVSSVNARGGPYLEVLNRG